MRSGTHSTTAGTLLTLGLLVVLLNGVSASAGSGVISLPTDCTHGNDYIQLAGFACIASEERLRNPSWNGRWEVQGNYMIAAYRIINEKMNFYGIHVGNTTFCANFTIVNAGCDGNITVGSFARTVSAEWAFVSDFLFADFGSTLALPNMIEANAAHKVIFVSMSSSTLLFKCQPEWNTSQPECLEANAKRFPYAYSMLIPGEYQMNPVATMYKLAGATKVVIWNERDLFPANLVRGLSPFAKDSGLEVIQLDVSKGPSRAEISDLVAKIKAIAPDGVIGAAYSDTCIKLYSEYRAQNYLPKGNAQTDCIAEPATAAFADDALYGIDKTEYDRRMTGQFWQDDFWYPPEPSESSPQRFYNDMHDHYNSSHWSVAMTSAAGLILHKAIQRAGSIDSDAIRGVLAMMNEPTFVGQVGFSFWGQNNVKDVILLQADQNFDLQIVYPLGSATSNLIYPAPTFDDRIFTSRYMSQVSEKVLGGVAGLFMLVSIGLFVFVIYNRKNRILISASPLFLATILFGSLMLYGAYFAWVLEARTAACYLRFWLLGIGFVTMFGALFAKTWRIMRIFTTSDLRVFQITNANLLVVLAILLGVEVILLSVWSGVSAPKQTVLVADPLRPARNRYVCSSGKSANVMLGLLVAFKLLMVLYGIYMSIRIWKIPLKQFNESRSIAFSMYNMLCFSILTLGLQLSKAINDPAMFIVRSVCLLLSTMFTILAIFMPKIIAIYTGNSGYSSTSGKGGQTTTQLNTVGASARHGSKPNSGLSRDDSFIAQEDSAAAVAVLESELQEWKQKYENLQRKYRELKSEDSDDTSS